MPPENVEIVRRMLDQFSAGAVERWLGYWDREAEWMAVGFGAVEGQPRTYRGHDGLRRFHADGLETFAHMRVDPRDFRDAGGRVVVLGEFRATGATSGAPFASSMAWIFEVQDGKVVRGRDYLDQQEALKAAGLAE
jgi:ketosteroid isomerase-like protein